MVWSPRSSDLSKQNDHTHLPLRNHTERGISQFSYSIAFRSLLSAANWVYLNMYPSLYVNYYFRVFLACFTKFSITPSNASLSPNFSSVLLVQYSNTSFAVPCISSNFFTCSFNSSIVRPFSASFVMVHNCLADTRSSCGAGGGPFLRRDSDRCLP